MFKTVVIEVAKEVLDVRIGAPSEKQCIRDETLLTVAKSRRKRCLEVPKKRKETYKSLRKEIKKKNRNDKKKWCKGQALEAEKQR